MTLKVRLQAVGIQLAILLSVVGLWIWANGDNVSVVLLPDLGQLIGHIPQVLGNPRTWVNVRVTILEILGAATFSIGVGLAFGFWAGRSAYLTRLLEPTFVWLQTVPVILIYPICVLILGLGSSSKVVFAGIYGLFPVVLNTMRGLRNVDERYLRTAESMGASRRQMTWFVRLPAARPMVISGIRLGAILNMIGVLAGQILASIRGIGYAITNAAQTFQILDLYAYIFLALVLAVAFNLIVSKADDKTLASQ